MTNNDFEKELQEKKINIIGKKYQNIKEIKWKITSMKSEINNNLFIKDVLDLLDGICECIEHLSVENNLSKDQINNLAIRRTGFERF